ncbi:MAG: hypothetical protein NPINA01_03410 [Nitrospinaceae bacterium]|nr:MAG: hypothetical protein NPINA01_03410 [Nitrospinaceae bacterium]
MLAVLEKLLNHKSLTNFVVPVFFSVVIGQALLSSDPNYFSLFLAVFASFAVLPLLNKPFALLQILIVIIPFSYMEILQTQIMKVPGLKVINILFVLTFVAFFLKNVRTNIAFAEKVFIVGTLSLLFIAVYRAVPQIPLFNFEMDENLNKLRFFQSFFLKPVVFFAPCIFIALYVSDLNKVELVLKTLVFSIIALSVFLLGVYLFFTPDKTDFENIRQSFSAVINLHGNNIATIYITIFPLLISYYFIKKNALSIVGIVLAVITIGLLYSRTAYLLLLISVFIYLFISKKFKLAPIIFVGLFIGVMFLPSSISQRATTGLESKDVYSISAGRVEGIWTPLVEEVLRSPKKLIFGSGLKAIFFSESYEKGQIYRTGHAHNLYLNTILDMGLVGLVFFMLFVVYLLRALFKAVKKSSFEEAQKEIIFGVIVAILSFLIAGFTGRLSYPAISNYPLWIIMAIGAALLKIQAKKDKLGIE